MYTYPDSQGGESMTGTYLMLGKSDGVFAYVITPVPGV